MSRIYSSVEPTLAGSVVNRILKIPIRVIWVGDIPKLMAGEIPLIPINVVLEQRKRFANTTRESIDTYVRAARLYAEFCAHKGRSLTDISNVEFSYFKNALLGFPFPDADGNQVRLAGKRNEATADLMLSLLYSIAADIEDQYQVRFDWHRYKGLSLELTGAMRSLKGSLRSSTFQRVHRIKHTKSKTIGLPDEQFQLLLQAARERWGDCLSDGDAAFAEHPESQRGALFYRNVAMLFVMRIEGGRRGEIPRIRLQDIDKVNSMLYLVTKGHGGEFGTRLPVLMPPVVYDLIWHYISRFRPISEHESDEVFLSHSTRNYGQPIGAQSVRKMLDALKPALDPPWNKLLTPHSLRHAFAYDLQKSGGPSAVVVNMRHASSRSGEPYMAGPAVFADELIEPLNAKMRQMLVRGGFMEILKI